ncbi:HNH endonuclease signature motif containing protein [Microbacterium rhizophilus]|uniref:HNH endonuclease signature motif containing protein n=1 Tax=Microbacterium rhizophilus TaxID=3138934 RepID=UPI0031ECF5D4
MPKFSDSEGPAWDFAPGERARTRAGIERLKRIRSERAALDAEEARVLAEVTGIAVDQIGRMPSHSDCAFPLRSMAAELALALKESPRAMHGRMDDAYDLIERFPATAAALTSGAITRRHAREIVAAGTRIGDDTARAGYEADVVPIAQTTTPFRTKQQAVLLAERHDPEPVQDRHERACAHRGSYVVEFPDAMAELRILMPAVRAYAIQDRLTAMGHVVKRDRRSLQRALDGTAPEPRSPEAIKAADDRHVGQLRADLAADLLLTGTPAGHDLDQHITATVEITIPVTTLTGLDDGAALLAGYGPIDPDTARRLAGHAAGWERLFLNPDTGSLLTVDHHSPTAAQRRYLHARDRTCRVPGCTTKAKHCDIDHTIPYSAGGVTNVHNLGCLCESHHMTKHHAPWGFTNLGHGRIRISSPCGYEYTEGPPLIFPNLGPPAPF